MSRERLNPKQIAFADEYIITGNAYESAIKAGYSERYAKGNSYKLVENSGISKYIAERMEKIQSEKIMSQEEVLEKLTAIARREVAKGIYKSKETVDGETVEVEKEYDHMPNIEEQTKALELLGKRYALFTDKVDLQSGDIVLRVGEWNEDEEN